jgi:site-specific DNA-methyltransferase (adenine-specific)
MLKEGSKRRYSGTKMGTFLDAEFLGMAKKKNDPMAFGDQVFDPDWVIQESAAYYGQNRQPFLFWRSDPEKAYLYYGDSLLLMETFLQKYPQGLFDLIFADPPDFLSNNGITCKSGKMASVNKGEWDKIATVEEMHAFNKAWLGLARRLLNPNGTIFVSGTSHVIHSIGFAMQELKFKLLNDISWVKPNPPPNLSCRYFTHATETILWAAKNAKSKHCFHYKEMCKLNKGKQMKSVWTISSPRPQEKTFGKHPTQKPVELLERILLAASSKGDLIFDPFSGSSTTGVAAIGLDRRFVGCELEEEYLALSAKRLEAAIKAKRERLNFEGIAR